MRVVKDFKQEVSFLRSAFKKHSLGKSPLTSVLDLGCGPGEHATRLAMVGVPFVVGLDAQQEMVEYAQSLAADRAQQQLDGGNLMFVQGDMTSFHKKHLAQAAGTSSGGGAAEPSSQATAGVRAAGFDLALCMLGTFTHLLSNAQALACFQCVSSALRPGGLFVLELAHPGDLFDGSLVMLDEADAEMWEVAKTRKGDRMLVTWGSGLDEFNPSTQVLERTVTLTVYDGTKSEDEVLQTIEDRVPARQYTVQEIDLLSRSAGLEVVALLGDMSTGVGLSHEDAHRLVAIIRKPLPA